MGRVYEAEQIAMRRKVAVKVISSSAHEDPQAFLDMVARFRREALAASKLEHPNTVRVFDHGATDDGILFLVMELLSGNTLSEVLRLEGRLTPMRVVRIGLQVCKSLAEAHAKGVIHRDLKPQNIFLAKVAGEKEEVVKVLDFGVAKILSPNAEEDKSTQSVIIGTPAYLAPERLEGRPSSPATDLYSLGVTLYECLCGKRPFVGDTNEVLRKHKEERVPPVDLPDVPQELKNLVYRLMEKKPEDRPASAVEVAEALENIYETIVMGEMATRGIIQTEGKISESVAKEDLVSTVPLQANGTQGKAPAEVMPHKKRFVLPFVVASLVGLLVAGGLVMYLLKTEDENLVPIQSPMETSKAQSIPYLLHLQTSCHKNRPS